MKLVEILAKELTDWPECVSITQDYDGDVGLYSISNPATCSAERAVWKFGGHIRNIAHLGRVASDHATAIVTREDWEKEKMKQAAPKKSAEGWIWHRGGKCPVEKGVRVDVRFRDGEISMNQPALEKGNPSEPWAHDWSHDGVSADIMAYRLHKPVEQVEACSKPDPRDSAKRDSDYVCWMRDRITEIDATTQALSAERAGLVQKLASEGFALIGRAVEPVEDYGNIQIGDHVSVIGIGGFSDCTGLSVGDIVEVTSVDNDESLKTVSGGSWGSIGYNYKFHSRPSA